MEDNAISILIVDDEENIRKTFGKILKLKGYNVEEAATGAAAIALVKEKFFNVVTLDIRLPDLIGLDVLRAIREINEETIVIMMTAYAAIDSSIDAMNNGAYSYLTKPLNMDAALAIIETALEKQRLSIENKRLMLELKKANEKLGEMDKRKSDFVAKVSHEFKNPLTAIKLSLDLILDEKESEFNAEEKKEFLTDAKRSAERLIRLVTDLLDLSKIEAGKMEMRIEQFDIGLLVNEILNTYEKEFSKKKILFSKNIASDLGLIWADRDKICEVIINLLTNAMKYTPDGGAVGIKLINKDNELYFEIFDTGPGIPEEYKDKIFDKFERITAESAEGTGLGLLIAKDIVELHKGRIWVESEAGKGSRFIFILPKANRPLGLHL